MCKKKSRLKVLDMDFWKRLPHEIVWMILEHSIMLELFPLRMSVYTDYTFLLKRLKTVCTVFRNAIDRNRNGKEVIWRPFILENTLFARLFYHQNAKFCELVLPDWLKITRDFDGSLVKRLRIKVDCVDVSAVSCWPVTYVPFFEFTLNGKVIEEVRLHSEDRTYKTFENYFYTLADYVSGNSEKEVPLISKSNMFIYPN